MPRYLISLTQANAALLEAQSGTRGEIVPSTGSLSDKRDGAIISGLDAITDEEYAPIRERLATGGPLYHAGGPTGWQAEEDREARARHARIRQQVSDQQRARRRLQLGEHTAEEFEQLVKEAAIDGRVDCELVLDLMTGAWHTGRSPHHTGRA